MDKSLEGLRVLNTRPLEQGRILSQKITEAGGLSITCPTLEIQETHSGWINELPDLNKVDCALFISANAVHYCFKQLQLHQIQWPNSIQIIAIGQGTEQALHQYQLQAHDLPSRPDSEHLLALSSMQQLKQKTVLLFKGIGGRTLIEEDLKRGQAKLMIFEVYQRLTPEINPQLMDSLWRDDAVDIILLTSEQSIQNLFKLFSQEAHAWLCNKPCLVISERLAQAASLLGIKKITISHPNRIIEGLHSWQKNKKLQ
jgi:uroporphyrinogen-III synthase